MKIIKVSVHKLFGVFNHVIELNNSRITIVIGENGLGKTIVLEMIEALFSEKYFYFYDIEFSSMTIWFSDNTYWVLEKKKLNEKGESSLILVNSKGKKDFINVTNLMSEEGALINEKVKISNIRRLNELAIYDVPDDFYRNEILFRHWRALNIKSSSDNKPKPEWYKEKHEKIKISLIETQRLISIGGKESKSYEKTVVKYSSELAGIIKTILTESTELSSKLDRTYPSRLINRLKESPNITEEDLNQGLANLEKKRELLNAVGLLETEKDSNFFEIASEQNLIRDVLMLYVEDSFRKIEIFDESAAKIKMLLDIINKRFKHKTLYVDKEKGFLLKSTIVKDAKGVFQTIPTTKLSSGEQNELVLFYLLLFKTDYNSLILIDEPEVSLHISWQNNFIEDLKQIAELNNLEVIIATHSPDIIANNWELKVELTGLQ